MVVGDIATGTDVVVIGGGPAGYTAAIRAAQHDLDVTLIEKNAYGGTCLNHGCIPSKALLHATDIAQQATNAEQFGVSFDEPEFDLPTMIDWKNDVVGQLTGGVEKLCKANGVNLMEGRAEFADENTVRVIHEGAGQGGETVEFEHAIVATGSRPIEVPGFEFDGELVLSSRGALALETIPDELLVVGAGYIGMELSTVFARLGTDVTVVEMLDDVLPAYEDDISRVVKGRAESLGIEFNFGEAASEWTEDGDGIVVTTETEDGETTEYAADKTLVAVGREPVTDTMNLEAAGLSTDEDGFLQTDEQLRTDIDGIFAVGDVAGEPMLAHEGMHAGEIAADVIAGEPAAFDNRAVPAAVFTEPEIATVGLTEREAADDGFEPIVGKMPMQASGRALTMEESDGFVRIVADEESGFVLGGQIVGPEASEMIAEVALAVEMGATLEDLTSTIHTHPTLSEAVMEAAANALGEAIHTLNR
ncbi:dihydrolipoyl dehydrogenase [Halocatena halophila]|uniref:dihydrolipoyl dehydrogenase n=1 Tax=Halocatena halophila TaxID=2814576 RepID=UPI002ED1C349